MIPPPGAAPWLRSHWTRGALLAALLVAAPRLAWAVDEEGRPPLLPDLPGCELWLGTSKGNDPTIRLHVRLCEAPDGSVEGDVQTSSLNSGWSHRRLEGRWSADHVDLTLTDLAIVEEHPNPGWRFCAVDQWSLQRHGMKLEGRWDSEECDDHAAVHLTFQSYMPGTSSKAPVPELPTRTAPTRVERGICGLCAIGGRAADGGATLAGLGLLGVLAALALRRSALKR